MVAEGSLEWADVDAVVVVVVVVVVGKLASWRVGELGIACVFVGR